MWLASKSVCKVVCSLCCIHTYMYVSTGIKPIVCDRDLQVIKPVQNVTSSAPYHACSTDGSGLSQHYIIIYTYTPGKYWMHVCIIPSVYYRKLLRKEKFCFHGCAQYAKNDWWNICRPCVYMQLVVNGLPHPDGLLSWKLAKWVTEEDNGCAREELEKLWMTHYIPLHAWLELCTDTRYPSALEHTVFFATNSTPHNIHNSNCE